MRNVRFLQTRVVDDHRKGTPSEERYEAGRVYPLAEPSAGRWVNRGIAEYVDAAAAKALKPATVEAPAEVAPNAAPAAAERRGMPRAKPTA